MTNKHSDKITGTTNTLKIKSRHGFRLLLVILAGLLTLSGLVYLAGPSNAAAAGTGEITVYKSPTCGCCGNWIKHLRDAGFKVKAINSNNLASLKQAAGVAPALQSCHTAFVDNYVIEGHVPASDIQRMLREKPDIAGLAVPGMVMGSPGMEGNQTRHYSVVAFDKNGKTTVYANH